MEGTRAGEGAGAGFAHTAVCYRTTAELVDVVLPFVEEGLARTEPVWVNLSAERLAALKSALGRSGSRPRPPRASPSGPEGGVHWTDTHQWHPHPARRLRAIGDLVRVQERHHPRRLRFVGECALPEGPPALVEEWERFDAVLNDALAGAPLTMVCTYDAKVLPAEVLERVQASHPTLGVTTPITNSQYVPPDQFCARAREPFALRPEGARYAGPKATPAEARSLVRAAARPEAGDGTPVEQAAAEDLAICATELVTNSWRAGAGRIEVWCWGQGGEAVAQVADDGPGWADPLAGYRRPQADDESGRGLWVARQLADVLQIRTDASGTVIQVRMLARAASVCPAPA